jgi:hypothetical protein
MPGDDAEGNGFRFHQEKNIVYLAGLLMGLLIHSESYTDIGYQN